MIEPVIYDRLDGIGTPVFPTKPDENTATLPHIVYTVTPAENTLFMSGTSNLIKYTVQIDAYAVTLKECLTALDAVKVQLNNWRAGSVQYCKWESHSTISSDPGAYAFDTYSLWYST